MMLHTYTLVILNGSPCSSQLSQQIVCITATRQGIPVNAKAGSIWLPVFYFCLQYTSPLGSLSHPNKANDKIWLPCKYLTVENPVAMSKECFTYIYSEAAAYVVAVQGIVEEKKKQ